MFSHRKLSLSKTSSIQHNRGHKLSTPNSRVSQLKRDLWAKGSKQTFSESLRKQEHDSAVSVRSAKTEGGNGQSNYHLFQNEGEESNTLFIPEFKRYRRPVKLELPDQALTIEEVFLRLNVGGTSYRIARSRIRKYSETLLYRFESEDHMDRMNLCQGYISDTQEYYFDRPSELFTLVVQFYQLGHVSLTEVHCVHDVVEELRYWGVEPKTLRSCCASGHVEHYLEELLGVDDSDSLLGEDEELAQIMECATRDFAKQCCGSLRKPVYEMLEMPSSPVAIIFMIISMGCVFISIITLVLSSLPAFNDRAANQINQRAVNQTNDTSVHDYLHHIDAACVAWFTFEYLLRLWAAPSPWMFVIAPLSIIDALAVFPFFIEALLDQLGVMNEAAERFRQSMYSVRMLRMLRVLRVLRILKVARYSKGFKSMGVTLRRSFPELILLFMFTVSTCLIFSTAMYFIECDVNDQFISIPAAMWWCITTMTTVGYGDICPKTIMGRMLASFVSISGIVLMAFPISIIVDNFGDSYYSSPKKNDDANEDLSPDTMELHRMMTSSPRNSTQLRKAVRRGTVAILSESDGAAFLSVQNRQTPRRLSDISTNDAGSTMKLDAAKLRRTKSHKVRNQYQNGPA